jgi:probable phosphoglycerate mutase
MGKLILVRHGESQANQRRVFAEDDTPLTDLGRRQARQVAENIAARFQPALVVSSEFLRAEQTARILAERFHAPLEIVPALHERDFGSLKGLAYEAFAELVTGDPAYDPRRPWHWTPPGGESAETVQTRVIAALETLRARHPHGNILVVCHGVVMLAAWAHLTGSWDGAEIPDNCAVVEIDHDETGLGSPRLCAF